MKEKTLVLFLGNPIFGDDAIGHVVGAKLKGKLESEGYDVELEERTGFGLLDYLEGRDTVVIVDSVKTGRHEVGEVIQMAPEEFEAQVPFSPHYVGIIETLRLMDQLGLEKPGQLHVVGIEIADPYTFTDRMSDSLIFFINKISEEVYNRIKALTRSHARQLAPSRPIEP